MAHKIQNVIKELSKGLWTITARDSAAIQELGSALNNSDIELLFDHDTCYSRQISPLAKASLYDELTQYLGSGMWFTIYIPT
jgi:hypothetical protein